MNTTGHGISSLGCSPQYLTPRIPQHAPVLSSALTSHLLLLGRFLNIREPGGLESSGRAGLTGEGGMSELHYVSVALSGLHRTGALLSAILW